MRVCQSVTGDINTELLEFPVKRESRASMSHRDDNLEISFIRHRRIPQIAINSKYYRGEGEEGEARSTYPRDLFSMRRATCRVA